MVKTDVLPEIEEEITEFDGHAHHVRIKALLAGGPVVALCGKKFVPTIIAGADAIPVCSKCAELMAMLDLMYPYRRA